MTALTTDLPGKSSRTSTQAVTVPSTAFTSAAATATRTLSFSAETASGAETAFHQPDQPSSADAEATAASGSATISDRNRATKPRERALPALSLERLTTRGRAAAVGAALARGGPSDRLLDLDHQALAREPLLVDGAPAAEDPVVDLEDPRSRGVLRRVLLRNRLVDRPEAVLREKILGPGRLGEADEVLRQ